MIDCFRAIRALASFATCCQSQTSKLSLEGRSCEVANVKMLIVCPQALLDKGPQNAGPAVLRLKAAAETEETIELLLLLVRSCILEGTVEEDDEFLTAIVKAK